MHIKRKIFNILCTGKNEKEKMALVRCRLAKPKVEWRWEIKNILRFSKALAVKFQTQHTVNYFLANPCCNKLIMQRGDRHGGIIYKPRGQIVTNYV
jgi:hypothetical protein